MAASLPVANGQALPPLTFKVHSPIPVQVDIPYDVLYVSVSHLLPEELPHSFSQFIGADFSVSVGVKLQKAHQEEPQSWWFPEGFPWISQSCGVTQPSPPV